MSSNVTERPKEFADVIGNKETVAQLSAMLEGKKGSVPHCILFSGPSGCGKTTLARIVADKIGCTEFDFKEYDVADNRGIDTAREIKQTAHLKPMAGPVKVYLLDEVHKATSDFQNAMLKITEEPPAHVYFILCTTEPDKLIKTLRNRCTAFTVSALPAKRIRLLLEKTAKKEGAEVSDDAFEMISENSEGSPRKALVIYDQIKVLDPEMQEKAVSKVIKNDAAVIDLCRALIGKPSWKTLSELIKGLDEDPEKIRRAVLGYCTAVALNGDNKKAILVIECFKDNFYDSGKAGLVYAAYQTIL
jgi:DNA polymerase-3 subunit gamma/tau